MIYETALQHQIGNCCLGVSGLKHLVPRSAEGLLSNTTLTHLLAHWPLEFSPKTGWRNGCLRKTVSENDSWTARQKWQAKDREKEDLLYIMWVLSKQKADFHLLAQTTNCPFEELNEQIKWNWITRYRIKLVVGVGLILWSTNSSSILLDSPSANLFHLSLFFFTFILLFL